MNTLKTRSCYFSTIPDLKPIYPETYPASHLYFQNHLPIAYTINKDDSYYRCFDPILCRKSFEFEDVVRLTAQQASREKEGRRSGLFHALSEDSIYEDIICKRFKESQDTCR